MEKVRFWKNTSSEFDKITTKDANTLYYLTDTGKIYLGDKMYGGTDVPITTINTANKSEFTTLKGILDHTDGMYLVDDCGVTNGDPQLTIASFKGHCSTVLMSSIAQFKEIMDSEEMKCYKGSVIYIQTDGDISNSSATRYVSICNVPAGASGEGDPDSPDRTFPGAGTSIFHIEVHPVEDRSSGTVTYSYDIDGGTQTLFTHPGYESLFTCYANTLIAGGLITGKSSYSPGQLIQVIEDKDSWYGGSDKGCRFTGVDASEFKSPLTLITNENATNYNTLDKLCHLDDGLYLCKDTYKTNQDYIVNVEFKGVNLSDLVTAAFTEEAPTPDTNGSTKCKNGAIISVVTQTGNTKNKVVRITNGLSANIDLSRGTAFEDIYIVAKPDDSTASTLVYGVTGTNVQYYEPFGASAIYGSLLPFAAMSATLFDGANANGKMAVWNKPESTEMPTLGYADIPSDVIPTFEVTDANAANYDSLEKWFSVDDGIYYINTTNVYGNNGGYIEVSKLKKVSFVGTGITSGSSGTGTKTIEDGVISLFNGATVYVNTTSDVDGHIEKYVQFNSVYVSGDISEYVLFRKMKSDTYSSANVYFIDILTNLSLSGQLAEEIVPVLGADGMFPNIITEDDELTSYNTLQKWMNLDPGRYLVMRSDLTVEVSATDVSKSADNSFTKTLSVPKNTFVFVYSTDDSSSSATNYKNVVFQKVDHPGSGYYGEWMTFKWDSRKTYSVDNVELYPLMTAAMNGAAAVELVNELTTVVDTKVDAAYVTNALSARDDKFQENESTSVVLNNHTEYRCKVMATLNLSLPETIPDDYNSRIVFESGDTATTLSYTADSIKFTGDDCDSSNVFVPAKNTSYEVDIKYLGVDSSGNKRIIARVGAF